jgi:hypothetical protein
VDRLTEQEAGELLGGRGLAHGLSTYLTLGGLSTLLTP